MICALFCAYVTLSEKVFKKGTLHHTVMESKSIFKAHTHTITYAAVICIYSDDIKRYLEASEAIRVRFLSPGPRADPRTEIRGIADPPVVDSLLTWELPLVTGPPAPAQLEDCVLQLPLNLDRPQDLG